MFDNISDSISRYNENKYIRFCVVENNVLDFSKTMKCLKTFTIPTLRKGK